MFFFDPLYLIIMLPVLIFSMWTQAKIKGSFAKYSRCGVSSGLTGARAAQLILESEEIKGVPIEHVSGTLTDHYSPKDSVIRLSQGVYDSNSIAAVAVAAHEAGHVLQHKHFSPIFFVWQTLAQPAAFASNASIWLILLGFLLGLLGLARIGFVLFAFTTAFQFIVLPLEFDASNKAKRILAQSGYIAGDEKKAVAAVLNSAALTYVAAATSSLAMLLYYALRLGLLGGRDN